MTGIKDCKSCQENVSLSLAKGILDEKNKQTKKNEWKFSNQPGEVMSASIYLTNRRTSFIFWLPYLEYDFMIANIVRLNLAVLKISETSQSFKHYKIYKLK